ncbi:MAG: DNA primase [Firmicutes bacterium]|nr:DNA primase [Bacillota bacterium]
MSFTQNSISNLKDQVNIVDVIGRAVTLQRKGGRYTGLCPFHKEKTASFSVNEQMQMYYCFGCHASGDVIEFVKKFYNLEFNEAVEKLAKDYGIQMEETSRRGENLDIYFKINQEAARFFYKSFSEGPNKGYAYMKKRGIRPEILKKFGIGYADEEWDSLYKHLRSLGYEEKLMIDLGLVSESKGKYYDKFRNRVMFPIINTSGKVIGFGGRAIDKDDNPKYLNSPESVVFKKKNNLYGLNLSRNAVSKEGYIILVEGYMDVIGLYQAGVENVSASLGTALTDSQAKMIKRYTNNVVLSYDADNAGIQAALRGMDILKAEDCNVSIMHVNDGKDPDEYIRKEGKKNFLNLVSNAKDYGEYKIEYAIRDLDMNDHRDRIESLKRIRSVLNTLDPAERDVYAEKISKDYNLSKMALLDQMDDKSGIGKTAFGRSGRGSPKDDEESKEKITLVEADIIRLVTKNEGYIRKVEEHPDIFTTDIAKNIFDAIAGDIANEDTLDINRVIDMLDDPEKGVLVQTVNRVIISGDEEEVFKDCIRRVKLRNLINESTMIDKILQTEDYQEDDIEKLMQRKMELQKLINKERIGDAN